FGRSMGVAVALTDGQGHILGKCHNAQPVWVLAPAASGRVGAECPFCIATLMPCTAVSEAFKKGGAVMVSDQAGLIHVAVPLSIGNQRLGAIVACQVFNRYPEPLRLRGVAKECGISAEQLWDAATN